MRGPVKKLAVVLLLLSSPALAQEKEFTFKLTTSMTNVIVKALNNAPYGEVAPVIAEMQRQATAQTQVQKSETAK